MCIEMKTDCIMHNIKEFPSLLLCRCKVHERGVQNGLSVKEALFQEKNMIEPTT